MAVNYYSSKTSVSDNDIKKPIENVFRSYRQQFNTLPLPKPPYTFKQLKWLLDKISKPLLKKYIHQFGKETYIGERPHTMQVSSKLLAFFMWIIAPEYSWSINPADEMFTNNECKDTIPENCYLDSCNDSRVWVNKNIPYPINWK